ncbi:MAG: MFS transporter, partial [Acidimicrobiia bacterium]
DGRPAASPWSPRVATFLAVEALSAIGSWATLITVWGYAAYEYDATAAEVSYFGLAFAIPAVVLGPLVGTIIDRIGPRATLAVAKVVGVVAALALLTADDFRSLALLSALHGAASAFSLPALQSMPPRLVGDDHLARTNALVSLTDELAIVLGPAAAGIGIAAFGFKGAFLFDACTYALGLVVLPLVRLHEPQGKVDTDPPVRLRDALEGWRLIARTDLLRRTVACTFAVHLLYGLALLAEPLYVRDVLHRSEDVFAALQTSFGIFLVAGGLIAARLGDRLASFGWVALGVAASGASALLYLSTPSIVVAVVGVALWGVATAVISGPSRTLLQRGSPEAAHGRVISADFVAANGAELLGIAFAGVLIGRFGVPWAVALLAAPIGAATLALAVGERRQRSAGPARARSSRSAGSWP